MDYPIFLGELCDLTSVNMVDFSRSPRRLSISLMTDIDSIFPFTEQESASICLKSALVVSRIFRHLPSPDPSYSDAASWGPETSVSKLAATSITTVIGSPRSLPYMKCCELQSFYALNMLLGRIRAAMYSGALSSCYHLLDRPVPATEVNDAERLIEELQQGIHWLTLSIRADNIFGGVASVARELEGMYSTAFPD